MKNATSWENVPTADIMNAADLLGCRISDILARTPAEVAADIESDSAPAEEERGLEPEDTLAEEIEGLEVGKSMEVPLTSAHDTLYIRRLGRGEYVYGRGENYVNTDSPDEIVRFFKIHSDGGLFASAGLEPIPQQQAQQSESEGDTYLVFTDSDGEETHCLVEKYAPVANPNKNPFVLRIYRERTLTDTGTFVDEADARDFWRELQDAQTRPELFAATIETPEGTVYLGDLQHLPNDVYRAWLDSLPTFTPQPEQQQAHKAESDPDKHLAFVTEGGTKVYHALKNRSALIYWYRFEAPNGYSGSEFDVRTLPNYAPTDSTDIAEIRERHRDIIGKALNGTYPDAVEIAPTNAGIVIHKGTGRAVAYYSTQTEAIAAINAAPGRGLRFEETSADSSVFFKLGCKEYTLVNSLFERIAEIHDDLMRFCGMTLDQAGSFLDPQTNHTPQPEQQQAQRAESEEKALAALREKTTRQLCELYNLTTDRDTKSPEDALHVATVRGWLQDTLEERDPEAFAEWMDCWEADRMNDPANFFGGLEPTYAAQPEQQQAQRTEAGATVVIYKDREELERYAAESVSAATVAPDGMLVGYRNEGMSIDADADDDTYTVLLSAAAYESAVANGWSKLLLDYVPPEGIADIYLGTTTTTMVGTELAALSDFERRGSGYSITLPKEPIRASWFGAYYLR